MSADSELDDGLAAFDQLGQKMTEKNRLLRSIQISQSERNRQENTLSVELQNALKQATGASQEALQASQTKIRSSLLWAGLTALLIVFIAFGGGYFFGQQTGTKKGQAEGYQTARDEKAATSWANTPSGQRAYNLDQLGSLNMLANCKGEGWKIEQQHGQSVCIPYSIPSGTAGWFIP